MSWLRHMLLLNTEFMCGCFVWQLGCALASVVGFGLSCVSNNAYMTIVSKAVRQDEQASIQAVIGLIATIAGAHRSLLPLLST